MMETVTTAAQLDAATRSWRERGEPIAFVPTMGNLHAGHLELVRRARAAAPHVVASIFVNPLQFDRRADFDAYPRTLENDRALLAEHGCELLYLPGPAELYPRGVEATTQVHVPGLSEILCGAFRPGHFIGVATVVAMLFNRVRPHVAVFGEKDFQQLLIIRRMVADLAMPVEVIGVPAVREPDGLAMSSRNGYLSAAERARAAWLYATLCDVRDRVRAGAPDFAAEEAVAMAALAEADWRPEYVSIRRAADLAAATPRDTDRVVLAAAWLGNARLIDNVRIDLSNEPADEVLSGVKG